MQRRIAAAERVLFLSGSGRRSFSQAAAPLHEAEVPKMPAFDFTPPPYSGPPAAEILAKRKEFLSPSLFHFYQKPVGFLLPGSTVSYSAIKDSVFLIKRPILNPSSAILFVFLYG